jgi:hypothetical protein
VTEADIPAEGPKRMALHYGLFIGACCDVYKSPAAASTVIYSGF